jgi:hypothetical protein
VSKVTGSCARSLSISANADNAKATAAINAMKAHKKASTLAELLPCASDVSTARECALELPEYFDKVCFVNSQTLTTLHPDNPETRNLTNPNTLKP